MILLQQKDLKRTLCCTKRIVCDWIIIISMYEFLSSLPQNFHPKTGRVSTTNALQEIQDSSINFL